MFPYRAPLAAFVTAALTAIACSSGGGGNGGPMTPDPPVVSGIAPVQARVGETVTISGTGFGTSASAVNVTIRGTAAEIASVTATAITATVPVIAPGPATVAVSVGGSAAGQAAFTVAQTPPVITSIEPTSIRAGEEITIRGEGFLEPVTAALVPADISVQLITSEQIEQLPVVRRDFSEIVALVPDHVPPGTHDVQVQVGDLTARRDDLDFAIPPIHYSFAGVGTITANNLNGLQVGRRTTYDFTLDETSFDRATGIGQLTARINGLYTLTGTFDRLGAFELGGPISQNRSYFFTGSFTNRPEPFTHTGVLVAQEGANQLRFEYDPAPAWSAEIIPTTKLEVSYGDIVTGNGNLPQATYLYDAYDPVSWTPAITLAGQVTGLWLTGTQPRKHIGTFNGGLRLFYDDVTVEGRAMSSIQAYYTPLNSTQPVTLVGRDANGNELVRNTFNPIDNQGIVNPVDWTITPPFPELDHLDVETAGNGFTAGILGGANLAPSDLSQDVVADRRQFNFE